MGKNPNEKQQAIIDHVSDVLELHGITEFILITNNDEITDISGVFKQFSRMHTLSIAISAAIPLYEQFSDMMEDNDE